MCSISYFYLCVYSVSHLNILGLNTALWELNGLYTTLHLDFGFFILQRTKTKTNTSLRKHLDIAQKFYVITETINR